ncbi:MAG TPA: protein kinase [Polyangiaceae bacterium]|nr:protein kinase [Polyangiaceae bacterium]
MAASEPPSAQPSEPPREAPRRDSVASFRVPTSSLTGAILDGRYKVHGCVERSAISRTLLAEDLRTHGAVWLRVLTRAGHADHARVASIRERLASLERVQHPNLLEVLGGGVTAGDSPYLVTEAVEGEALEQVLLRQERLSPDICLVLARQAAGALAALHAAGVIHGRLDPSRIVLLGSPNEPYGLKVTDYGTSRLFEPPGSDADSIPLDYRAPEQLTDGTARTQSDVYALGVLLFRLLTFQLPFCGAGPTGSTAESWSRLYSPLPAPAGLESRIDPRIEAVILNATRKRPENRYPSVADLVMDLDALVGLSTHDVTIRSLRVSPDLFEPETQAGTEALRRAQLNRGT